MRFLLLAGLLACTACTVGPDYQRPEMPLPSEFPESVPAEGAAVEPGWWKLYRDPVLDGLIADGQKNNADLRQAVARVQEAEGALREVRAQFWPEVDVNAAAARQRVSTLANPPVPSSFSVVRPNYQALLTTSYEIDFWGRLRRSSESAQASLLATKLARDVVDLTLAGAIAQSYFALRSFDTQITVLDNSIRARQESLDIAKARASGGLASELDVFQAQGALSDAIVQRRDAVRSRALVQHQLAQLAGRLELKLPADQLPGDLFALPIVPVPPAGLPSALIDRRPDIRQAEETLVSFNAQIGVAKAALFPTISLTAFGGVQSAVFGDLVAGPGARIWSVGANLVGPIFDAGRRGARVEQADARRLQALAGYQRAIETGFREVSDALVNVQQTGDSEEELLARLKAARSALDLSTLRYQSGYSPYLEVLDAQRTANDAEIAFVRNRQSRLSFSVDLMKALGGGWSDATVSPARP